MLSILDAYLVYICQLRFSSNIMLYHISKYEAADPLSTSNVKLEFSPAIITERPSVCECVCVCVPV